eukprot:1175847-Prorocentrum_minimum.AAC.1
MFQIIPVKRILLLERMRREPRRESTRSRTVPVRLRAGGIVRLPHAEVHLASVRVRHPLELLPSDARPRQVPPGVGDHVERLVQALLQGARRAQVQQQRHAPDAQVAARRRAGLRQRREEHPLQRLEAVEACEGNSSP